MSNLELIDRHIKQQALKRYQHFAQSPIVGLMVPSSTFRHISDEHVNFLISHQRDIRLWYQQNVSPVLQQSVLDFFINRTLNYLYLHNQFLIIPERSHDRLRSIYIRFIQSYLMAAYKFQNRKTLKQKLATVLADHQTRLAIFIQDVGTRNNGLDLTLAEPVCGQYSAKFQLALLELSVHSLLEPVLDVGCGPEALLVLSLQEQGKRAYGIDRGTVNTENTFRLDWFNFPFGVNQWGTIISHMAFSIHFLHHHFRRNGHPEKFASLYMLILQSLQIDGQFIYAPGLPFIEDLLPPDLYKVQRYAVNRSDLIFPNTPTLNDISYTAVITRCR